MGWKLKSYDNMKSTILRFFILALVILAGNIFIIRKFFGSKDSITYRIFKEESNGYFFHKLLGILPSDYQDRYSRKVLESFDNIKLVYYEDGLDPLNHSFIVVSTGNESKFLKAYPFDLVGVNKEEVIQKGWNKHVSLLVNLEVFNEYVRLRKIKSKKEIIKKYCSFISNPIDDSSHYILSSVSDIDSLVKRWPIINEDFLKASGYKLLDRKVIEIKQSDQTIFCWFYYKGVVKFIFSFNDDNTIKSVDSNIIGLIGNEMPSI